MVCSPTEITAAIELNHLLHETVWSEFHWKLIIIYVGRRNTHVSVHMAHHNWYKVLTPLQQTFSVHTTQHQDEHVTKGMNFLCLIKFGSGIRWTYRFGPHHWSDFLGQPMLDKLPQLLLLQPAYHTTHTKQFKSNWWFPDENVQLHMHYFKSKKCTLWQLKKFKAISWNK